MLRSGSTGWRPCGRRAPPPARGGTRGRRTPGARSARRSVARRRFSIPSGEAVVLAHHEALAGGLHLLRSWRASSRLRTRGFSRITVCPARSAARLSSAWVGVGVAITTTSASTSSARAGPGSAALRAHVQLVAGLLQPVAVDVADAGQDQVLGPDHVARPGARAPAPRSAGWSAPSCWERRGCHLEVPSRLRGSGRRAPGPAGSRSGPLPPGALRIEGGRWPVGAREARGRTSAGTSPARQRSRSARRGPARRPASPARLARPARTTRASSSAPGGRRRAGRRPTRAYSPIPPRRSGRARRPPGRATAGDRSAPGGERPVRHLARLQDVCAPGAPSGSLASTSLTSRW